MNLTTYRDIVITVEENGTFAAVAEGQRVEAKTLENCKKQIDAILGELTPFTPFEAIELQRWGAVPVAVRFVSRRKDGKVRTEDGRYHDLTGIYDGIYYRRDPAIEAALLALKEEEDAADVAFGKRREALVAKLTRVTKPPQEGAK